MVKSHLSKPLYRIRDPKNFYKDMREDVELLREHRAHMSLTTVIVCCLDALAAGSGQADKAKFLRFVTRHFPDLCKRLKEVSLAKKEVSGKKKGALIKREGARVLYEESLVSGYKSNRISWLEIALRGSLESMS